jgi:hypothetical protein
MRRKLKWIALILLVLVVGLGAAFVMWPSDGITADAYRKIEFGMTEKEVEKILGAPGSDIKSLPDQDKRELLAGLINRETRLWVGQRAIVGIHFLQGGTVSGTKFYVSRTAGPTFINHLRDWLGW